MVILVHHVRQTVAQTSGNFVFRLMCLLLVGTPFGLDYSGQWLIHFYIFGEGLSFCHLSAYNLSRMVMVLSWSPDLQKAG